MLQDMGIVQKLQNCKELQVLSTGKNICLSFTNHNGYTQTII